MSLSLALGASACGVDSPPPEDPPPGGGSQEPPPPPPPAVWSTKVSRASTIQLTDNEAHVVMVNPDDGSISVFQTTDHTRIAKVATGGNPSSVVIMGDNKTAYVANRAEGTVSRVINIDTGKPTADAKVNVGSEPVGLALAPSGLKLFVAEFAESRVSVIDTVSFAVVQTIKVDRPRAILVTNNADQNDSDETLVVSQYFGVAAEGGEAKDDGRTGRILTVPLNNLSSQGGEILLAPTDSGFGPVTSPNQLASMAVAGNRLYVTSVSVSPALPTRFDNNVFPVVHVADLATLNEIRDASGTASLAAKIRDRFDADGEPISASNPRFIPGDLSDIAFLDNSQVGYTVSRAGDVMIRLQYGATLDIGADQVKEIDLLAAPQRANIVPCQAPIGIAVSKALGRGYVNCWVNRRLALVEFRDQVMTASFEASAPPVGDDAVVQKGKRFFFTGRARWSNGGLNGAIGGEGWSACGSCHPDGLTDNVTWAFGSGPRQTTSMDGSFSHGPGVGPQKQRIFNWTAINDELHDFEANVRGVSGGKGVITSGDCSSVDKETQVTFKGPMTASNKELADSQVAPCKRSDWDDITEYTKTITPSRGPRFEDAQAIARGRALFLEGGCNNCHAGAGWTVSRRPYSPATVATTTLGGAEVLAPQPFSTGVFNAPVVYLPRTQISNQPALNSDSSGPATAEVPVLQLACALRNVGTYGIPGDNAATTSFEIRPVGTATGTAQGRAGYNVPSLYGLALGAPYLHHGQSPSLEDLLTNQQWRRHTNAGNPNFFVTLNESGKLSDLIKFLLSIDATTEELNIPSRNGTSMDLCPGTPGQSL